MDVLRLIAFLAVFMAHGPRLYADYAGAPRWAVAAAHVFNTFAVSGVNGVLLFFLLSSYLITELLLQERAKTGTVHLKAFYVRRLLRIWPLYFLGVALAIGYGALVPTVALSRQQVLYLLLFVGWLGKEFNDNPMGPLWSISVEEIFYAVWPSVAKFQGAASILIASLVIVLISLSVAVYSRNWYNPVPKFMLFAFGAFLALWLHRSKYSLPNAARIPTILLAIGSWGFLSSVPLPFPPAWSIIAAQLVVAFSCALLFLALYGCPTRYLPRPLIYLGRISYGLYVFHLLILDSVHRWLMPFVTASPRSIPARIFEYTSSLALTIAISAMSFHFFETPFLKLKRRFTFVRSRD